MIGLLSRREPATAGLVSSPLAADDREEANGQADKEGENGIGDIAPKTGAFGMKAFGPSCADVERFCSSAGYSPFGRPRHLDAHNLIGRPVDPVRPVPPPAGTRRVHAVCPHDCPDTCAMVVDVEDKAEGPVAVRIGGDPAHPVTRGALCAKVNRYIERTYHKERLAYPMRRIGRKGEGKFERISWDEAIEAVANAMKQSIKNNGPQSILPYSYAGTMGVLQYGSTDRRLFHRIGASLLDRTICSTPGEVGTRMTLGATIGTDPEAFEHSEVIFLWGTNTITSNVHLWPFIKAAQRKGATVVTIDPRRTRTAEQSDQHVAPLPGTDAALALGMMHVLFRNNKADLDYLKQATVGWEQLRDRVMEQYPPERTDTICGLPPGTTEALANLWGSTKKAVLRLNYGMQRHYGGGSAVRVLTCLPAISGAYREPSGGSLLSTSDVFNRSLDSHDFQRKQWIPNETRTINMSRLGEALLDTNDPPVNVLVVYNSNPAAIAPDQARVTKGLEREDLFTVVLEHFPTDTTDYADIVLPATTQLEHSDLHTAYGHYFLQWNDAAIQPLGESLPNTEIFRKIAIAMGYGDDKDIMMSDDDMARELLATKHPRFAGITLDRLKQEHSVRLNLPKSWAPYANGSPFTDDGKIHITSEEAKNWGMDVVPDYVPPAETPDGEGTTSTWDKGTPTHGDQTHRAFPLRFLSPPAHHFLNSSFANVLRANERGTPWIEIHPDDAAARGIQTGDTVRVHNARGQVQLIAEITDRTRPGIVVAPSVWWRKHTTDGANANMLTSERISDMGGGATFYDAVCEVRKITSQ